jgi:tetratricopeptide (TPR) repeat protein
VLDIATELKDSWWEAHGYNGLGAASMATRAFQDARYYSEQAALRWDRIGDPWGSIWPGQTLGGLAAVEGDFAKAKERYLFVLETAQSVNFRRGLQYTYNNLGNVSFRLKEYLEADGFYLKSLGISDEIGNPREMLATLNDIVRVWAATERVGEAIELLAIVLKHPAREQHGLLRPVTIQEDAEQLRVELEAALAPEDYEAAWRRGQAAELDAVVAELLD